MMDTKNSFLCPFCQAEVPKGALACPACGSDEQTGWSDDIYGLRSEGVKEKTNPILKRIRILFFATMGILIVLTLIINQVTLILFPLLLFSVILLILIEILYARNKDTMGRDIYAKFLLQARGDKELIERLVNYERKRNPFRTRKQLLLDALDRLEKDNR